LTRARLALAAAVLALCACERPTKTVVIGPPPVPGGSYSATWATAGGVLEGGAVLSEGDSSILLHLFPCAPAGVEDVGGSFELAGDSLAAELKTLDGLVRLTILGDFDARGALEGRFWAQVLGVTCDVGAVHLEPVP